jgi:hypothetical protein
MKITWILGLVLVPIAAAAEIQVLSAARGGQLPSFRIGNRWRFRASDLDDWAHGALISAHSLRRE